MPNHPLAEVFGFPYDNLSPKAERYRKSALCPYNNRVPSCTKNSARDPLGVCSIFENDHVVITCPVRFREEWLIIEDAANFFFPPGTRWTSLSEVRLNDIDGNSAGNIDFVIVSLDAAGHILDFGALEVQGVYISGNISNPFKHYMQHRQQDYDFDWTDIAARPDYLSSSRKRLAPQLIYKGGILREWNKKIAVAIQDCFYATLPVLPEVPSLEADIAWFIYSLVADPAEGLYHLVHSRTVYTRFNPALTAITTTKAGNIQLFIDNLQQKLDEGKLTYPPVNSTLLDPQTEG